VLKQDMKWMVAWRSDTVLTGWVPQA
jgi:hypothetical protein